MDDNQRSEIIRIGNLAKEVIENEAFQVAVNASMNDVFARFLASEPAEDDVRFKIWATGQALDAIKSRLEFLVQNGKLELENRKMDDDR